MRDLDEKELDRINQELQSISLCQGHDYDLPVRPLEEMIAATMIIAMISVRNKFGRKNENDNFRTRSNKNFSGRKQH